MPKFAVNLLCVALAIVAGCATPEAPPAEWSATDDVRQAQTPKPFKAIPPSVHTNSPPVVKTPAPPPPAPPAAAKPLPVAVHQPPATNVFRPLPAPVNTFTSLQRWAAEHKLGPPCLLSRSPLMTYSLASPRGVILLAIGSREATWNGVMLHLGHAPEIIDGEVFVHGLDLQKNVEPFLCDPAPVFGPNRVIVLDPGHGGENAGTVSVTDRKPEKEFTLDWARRLQPLLEREGWRVFLTRTNDLDVALSNRVATAQNLHADLFLSLHFNSAAPDQKPAGLETFCLTPVGLPSDVTRGYPDIPLQQYPNNSFDTENVQLAERLQRSLLRATGLEDRGVSRARFLGVLRGQRRPSVLIEAGFMSNPREARRIESADFRQKLAEAVAAALKQGAGGGLKIQNGN